MHHSPWSEFDYTAVRTFYSKFRKRKKRSCKAAFVFAFIYADMHISNEFSLPALVALTADKLAGGPLREYLEKTEEHVALRSVQFWEDSQRYLTPPENFGSYSKYHSAKTLLATYIAPDSPRIMAMSPQVRADLMRLLLQERGDHLLSTVVKASIQVNGCEESWF